MAITKTSYQIKLVYTYDPEELANQDTDYSGTRSISLDVEGLDVSTDQGRAAARSRYTQFYNAIFNYSGSQANIYGPYLKKMIQPTNWLDTSDEIEATPISCTLGGKYTYELSEEMDNPA